MPYGTVKVDNITFTNNGVDTTITVSGLAESTTGNLTVTGTISGSTANFVSGSFSTRVSGLTVAGTTGTFTSLTGTTTQGTTATFTTGSFTSLTGTTTTGTTANFVSGVFTTQVSGATITGTTVAATTGTFTTVTGGVITITSGVFALGSAAAPSISFSGDADNGIYSPGANQVAISTSGTGRLFVTSAGLVGIGTSAPSVLLHSVVSSAGVAYRGGHNNTGFDVYVDDSTGEARLVAKRNGGSGGKFMSFYTDTGSGEFERVRIDSSGRLLVGTSTARANFYNGTDTATFQVEGANDITKRFSSFIYGRDNSDGPLLLLGKHRGTSVGGTTVVASGDEIGRITFQGSDGTQFVAGAEIQAYVDATPGADDMPGRIVLATTADGASSPTERARITSGGYFKASNSGTYTSATGTYHEFYQTANAITLWTRNTEANLSTTVYYATAARAANSAFQFFVATSSYGGTADDEFNLRGDGNAFADGSWTGGGADYAEYFEWSDGNPDAEDRRGISVVLDGDKIREALPGEDPIGVISGNPSIVGDAAWNKWSGKYLRDEFGTYILEDYEVTDDDGNTVTQQRRKLNPAYDPDAEYIPREQRPEWDCVGLMGKLRIRKGQITGSRWIKMRDINNSVEEWLVR